MVFARAEQDGLAGKLAATNNHRAATSGCQRKTTGPERWRPGASVFVSRLNFPEATGDVVFILAVAYLKKALAVVRAVGQLAPSPVADFFSSLGGARTAFARHPGPPVRLPGGKLKA